MNIYTLRTNLVLTIAGKEKLLERQLLEEQHMNQTPVVSDMLKINIAELRRILEDVELCCENATAQSWIGVDRQGGI